MKGMKKVVVGLSLIGLVLTGCSGKKEEQKLVIENFDLVDSYEYDKVKVVVEEEKTPEELAYEVIMDSMGLALNTEEGYKEVGIDEGNGVFINAGILEGSHIPNVSGYSSEDIASFNNGKDKSEDRKVEEYLKLQENRERKVSVYDEDAALEDAKRRIEQAAKEQEIRIKEQEEEAQKQQEEKGEPEFSVE